MFGIRHYLDFVLAILVFQLIPGPGTLTILGATAQGGVRAGMAAVAGTLMADFVYMSSAMLGLAAVLAAYPVAFGVLRWIGIAYLVWVGIGMLRARSGGAAAPAPVPAAARVHLRRAFAVGLSNPKAILFFLAFFPIFLRADAGGPTLALMAAHVMLLGLAYQVLLVLAGNAAARRLERIPAVRILAKQLAGAALVGFGLRLALDRR